MKKLFGPRFLWFFGIGSFLGYHQFYSSSTNYPILTVLLGILVGSIEGGSLYIVFRLVLISVGKMIPENKQSDDPKEKWECPSCKMENSNKTFVCSKCGFKIV
jgi:hypothetical protein